MPSTLKKRFKKGCKRKPCAQVLYLCNVLTFFRENEIFIEVLIGLISFSFIFFFFKYDWRGFCFLLGILFQCTRASLVYLAASSLKIGKQVLFNALGSHLLSPSKIIE